MLDLNADMRMHDPALDDDDTICEACFGAGEIGRVVRSGLLGLERTTTYWECLACDGRGHLRGDGDTTR